MIELVLPGKPRGKGVARTFMLNGRPVTTTPPATREYMRNMYAVATHKMEALGMRPLDGPLAVTIQAWMPIPRSWSKKKRATALHGEIYPTGKPDANNISKMCDGLNGVCWEDDSQIISETVVKRYSLVPRMVIRIEIVAPGQLEPDLPF